MLLGIQEGDMGPSVSVSKGLGCVVDEANRAISGAKVSSNPMHPLLVQRYISFRVRKVTYGLVDLHQ